MRWLQIAAEAVILLYALMALSECLLLVVVIGVNGRRTGLPKAEVRSDMWWAIRSSPVWPYLIWHGWQMNRQDRDRKESDG